MASSYARYLVVVGFSEDSLHSRPWLLPRGSLVVDGLSSKAPYLGRVVVEGFFQRSLVVDGFFEGSLIVDGFFEGSLLVTIVVDGFFLGSPS